MIQYEGIDRNFQFLVLEVRRQLETTARLLQAPGDGLLRTILSRDNYTDTLKALVEKKCVSYFRHTPTIDRSSANLVTAIHTITSNLERIADFCVNIATQVRSLSEYQFTTRFRFADSLKSLIDALPKVESALSSLDASLAIGLCRIEDRLDAIYDLDYCDIREMLRSGRDTDDLLRCLYIAHYLERMGDAMLNVGEAILFAATGEKLKLHEYDLLNEAIGEDRESEPLANVDIEFNWETRSGCRIAKVQDQSGDGSEQAAVFKKGHAEKLRKERENIERWEKVFPGLPPRILDFREGGDDAALLLQFLDGYTLRDLALGADDEIVDQGVGCVENMLRTVWTATRRDEPVNANFIVQARQRLDDVFRLHPEFVNACYEVGSRRFLSLEDLLEAGQKAEQSLDAPFRVLIHGDFNADNIIYDQRQHRVHVIDLYRSKESDYVQDISVLLVSHFRCPVLGGHVRDTLNRVIIRLCKFANEFAQQHNDRTFPARLALGLARAFITSTRFEVDQHFARTMYSRAVYLLEKVIDWVQASDKELQVNAEVLLY